ncbi:hypothetical protein ACOTFF_15915 [Achromobacter xylosoxidans]
MNTISASAPPARIRPMRTVAKAARKLGGLIAPRDHAGKGNWNEDADIPLWAWPAAVALAGFFLFGAEILGWLLRIAL